MQHRHRTRALWTALALSACTSHRPVEPSVEHEEPPADNVSSVSPSLEQALAWRWIHRGEPGGWSVDIGPRSIQAGAWSCYHQHDDQAHTPGKVCCEGQPSPWCVELREDFVPGISLASDGQRLFIADYPAISSGARFAAHDLATGEQLWTREAVAIGPQAHSEYFNVVQLRLVGDELIAYGDEAHGAYVEAMDPGSGALRRHATLTAPTVEWTWDATAPEPEPIVTLALAGDGTCRFESSDDETPSTLSCERPLGSTKWTLQLDSDFVGRGALVSDGARVVLLTWSRIASGARARAFALADGAILWDRPVEGIGPQDHSKYSNLIQLGLDGDVVVIRGQEAHGRYIEALELTTGALRWSVQWPAF
jgi:hypothetical protein